MRVSMGDAIFVLLSIVIISSFAVSDYKKNDYVGSEKCAECHIEKYETWKNSRHSKMLIHTDIAKKYGYPTPPGYSWDNISYVVGGKWKLRYIDKEGYMIIGDKVQYDIEKKVWTPFYGYGNNISKVKYNCARCHTTGYDKYDKNELPGIVGTWEEYGIACERCHGQGKLHSENPTKYRMIVIMDSELCAPCHTQGDWYYINEERRHHSQYNDFYQSVHYEIGMECIDCHDPHKISRSEYGDMALRDKVLSPQPAMYIGWDGDIYTEDFIYEDDWDEICLKCHDKSMKKINCGNETIKPSCRDCHMPKSRKSAHKWDISSHTFKVDDGVKYTKPPERNFPNLTCYEKCHKYYRPLSDDEINKSMHFDYSKAVKPPEKHRNVSPSIEPSIEGQLSALFVVSIGAIFLFWRRIE